MKRSDIQIDCNRLLIQRTLEIRSSFRTSAWTFLADITVGRTASLSAPWRADTKCDQFSIGARAKHHSGHHGTMAPWRACSGAVGAQILF